MILLASSQFVTQSLLMAKYKFEKKEVAGPNGNCLVLLSRKYILFGALMHLLLIAIVLKTSFE